MLALSLIQLCAREYNDIGYQRIGRDATSAANPNQANWLDWLNDALRTVVLVRPDAGALTSSLQLVAGTKQALPANGIALLDVTRNMGNGGVTPGPSIRFSDRLVKDDTNRNWHTAVDAGVVREVLYDDKKDPLIFYVSPPASNKYIEATICYEPAPILDANVLTANWPLPVTYAGPAQAWMLHRAFALQSQSPPNFQRAWNYFSSFFSQLGVKLKAELFAAAAAQPERRPGEKP